MFSVMSRSVKACTREDVLNRPIKVQKYHFVRHRVRYEIAAVGSKCSNGKRLACYSEALD